MSIGVSDEFKDAHANHTRTFYFGRVHDGIASIISETTSATVNVSSDKFSTFSLAYKDTDNSKDKDSESSKDSDDDSDDEASDNDSGSKKSQGAKTGDDNDIAGLLTIMLASAGALGTVIYRRRRED